MVVLIVGLGSMGKRRARLIKAAYPQIKIIGVDKSLERIKEAESLLNIKTYESMDEAIKVEKPSAAFISTSPLTHSSIIQECLKNNIHVFTELNLVNDGYDNIIKLANERQLKLFVSSTLLYRNDIKYITTEVKEKKVNYIYHVGQYLPDWHPWESYKNYFVGKKRTNGCREIFAIDLPWIINAFGEVESFNVMKDKSSNLEIDYNDNYLVSFKHKNGNKGIVCVDVVSRKAVRTLEVFSEEIHMFWDGTPNGLYKYDLEEKTNKKIETYTSIDKDNNYSDNIIENAYLDEIITFFSYIENEIVPLYTIKDDIKVLALIDEIEEE